MRKWEKKLRQPEKFICISYPQIDFLIPNDYVISSVGVKDLNISLLNNQEAGFFDFDDIASCFIQIPRQADIRTMIVLKGNGDSQFSIITTQECKVSTIPLNEFGLFSDFYSEQFQKLGFLACSFKDERLRILMDVKQTIAYMKDSQLEEL